MLFKGEYKGSPVPAAAVTKVLVLLLDYVLTLPHMISQGLDLVVLEVLGEALSRGNGN